MIWILYSSLSNDYDISALLKSIMWGGYVACIFALFVVGIDKLLLMGVVGDRMEGIFVNVNTLGMAAAASITISFYFFLYEKKSALFCFNILPMVIITATGSRKALVSVLLGVIMLFLLKKRSKSKLEGIVKFIFTVVALYLVIRFILSLDIFYSLNLRMEGLIASFTGKGDIDHSAMVRADLRTVGFEQVLKTPFTGLGIDCGRYLALKATGYFFYLHCNYAELLADIGLLGCLSYYLIYLRGLRDLRKYWNLDTKNYLVVILIGVKLVMDYGCVSYYERDTYIMMAVLYLQIMNNKRKSILSFPEKR